MGYIKHNALIIEIHDFHSPLYDVYAEILRACNDVRTEDGKYLNIAVSPLMKSSVNCEYFVFIAPDGSKEGWKHSEAGDKFRDSLFKRITSKYPESVDILDVRFGGDDGYVETKWYSAYGED
jgi:hypothetical protein